MQQKSTELSGGLGWPAKKSHFQGICGVNRFFTVFFTRVSVAIVLIRDHLMGSVA
jgi:hypothetical protein